ncbi:hypothetical protein ACGFR6_04195 [Streptomyces sp. NPDC048567]|uniref:hypothetical protein n=1 Tax=Streptomyces sp. NPDC048567 TaxID=3365570 RepID=UPI0037216DA4
MTTAHDRRSLGVPLTDMTEALGLHDMASKIARLRLRLRALMPPSVPSVSTACGLLDGLTEIATTANQQLKNFSEPSSRDREIALFTYCYALDPLGECITELGRVNTAVLTFHLQAKSIHRKHAIAGKNSDHSPDIEAAWQDASEYVSSGYEAANDILKTLEGDLQRTAIGLAPPADSLPLNASNARQNHPDPALVVASAPSAATTAKGR